MQIERVLDGQHVVASRLGPPELLKVPQHVGVLGGDVDRLGEVVGEPEQVPAVAVEVAAALEQLHLVDDAL